MRKCLKVLGTEFRHGVTAGGEKAAACLVCSQVEEGRTRKRPSRLTECHVSPLYRYHPGTIEGRAPHRVPNDVRCQQQQVSHLRFRIEGRVLTNERKLGGDDPQTIEIVRGCNHIR